MKAICFATLLLCLTTYANGASSQCGNETKIDNAIADLTDYYGDVNPPLECNNPNTKAEQLICSDDHLLLMYRLNTMAEVYATENATKMPLEHGTYEPTIPNCKDKRCLCNSFMESTNDYLGGESPYYYSD